MGLQIKAAELKKYIQSEVGVSNWITISQNQINQFGESTHDMQYIHCDPEQAKDSPFGGTIAHGFLSLSLLSAIAYEAGIELENTVMGLNYGFEKIRFLQPVAVNKRVRGRMYLENVIEKRPNQFLFTWNVTVEIEHEEKPAMTAQWLTMTIIDQ